MSTTPLWMQLGGRPERGVFLIAAQYPGRHGLAENLNSERQVGAHWDLLHALGKL